MVRLFGDYIKYLSFIDKVPIFNKESFLETRKNKNHEFFDQFTETQSFLFFLQQDPKESYTVFCKLSHQFADEDKKQSKNSKKTILEMRKASSTFIEKIPLSFLDNKSKISYKKKDDDSSFYSSNSDSDSSTITYHDYKEIYFIVPYFDTEKKLKQEVSFNEESTENLECQTNIVVENIKEFNYPKKGAKYMRYIIPHLQTTPKIKDKDKESNDKVHPHFEEFPEALGNF